MTALISHQTESYFENELIKSRLDEIECRIKSKDASYLSKEETLRLAKELSNFPLGRFLLMNKGLNGYWTAYIFRNPIPPVDASDLERWLLTKSLFVMARERFNMFQALLKQQLFTGIRIASVPCGLMDDLLTLDYGEIKEFSLVGIDIDQESLKFAQENATAAGLIDHCQFLQKDAWNLQMTEVADILVSNGLNMYEGSPEKLVSLYKQFSSALVQGGRLLLSFIPPPQGQLKGIAPEDFLIDRAIFNDIVEVNYLNFCSEEAIRAQLNEAGLDVERIVYNQHGLAPVLLATKR